MFFLHQSTFLAHNPHDRHHREIFERRIHGTKIIHVPLDPVICELNLHAEFIANYIQQNINPNFHGFVSKTPSYNSDKNGSVTWCIKNSPDFLAAIYFDGGSRPGIDQQYDLIDLRWLGNGSPHMYCFWKTDFLNVLKNNDVVKNNDVKNAHNNGNIIGENTLLMNEDAKKLIIEKIFKAIVAQLTDKAMEIISVVNAFILKHFGVNIEQLVDVITDIFQKNPEALEAVIKIISFIEDAIMHLLFNK